MSIPILSKYLTTAGIVLTPGRKKGSKPVNKDYHSGCLAKFLRENPGKVLPRDLGQIASLTGCTKDEIKCYLYRRRNHIKAKVEKLFRPIRDGILFDTKGTPIHSRNFYKVERVHVDPYTFEATVEITLRNGQRRSFPGSYDLLSQSFNKGAEVSLIKNSS